MQLPKPEKKYMTRHETPTWRNTLVGGQAYQEGWMLIPSYGVANNKNKPSLSRRVNANSQPGNKVDMLIDKLIKKGEC